MNKRTKVQFWRWLLLWCSVVGAVALIVAGLWVWGGLSEFNRKRSIPLAEVGVREDFRDLAVCGRGAGEVHVSLALSREGSRPEVTSVSLSGEMNGSPLMVMSRPEGVLVTSVPGPGGDGRDETVRLTISGGEVVIRVVRRAGLVSGSVALTDEVYGQRTVGECRFSDKLQDVISSFG